MKFPSPEKPRRQAMSIPGQEGRKTGIESETELRDVWPGYLGPGQARTTTVISYRAQSWALTIKNRIPRLLLENIEHHIRPSNPATSDSYQLPPYLTAKNYTKDACSQRNRKLWEMNHFRMMFCIRDCHNNSNLHHKSTFCFLYKKFPPLCCPVLSSWSFPSPHSYMTVKLSGCKIHGFSSFFLKLKTRAVSVSLSALTPPPV